MITLTGVSRFRLGAELDAGTTPYRRMHVDWGGFERDLGKAETDPGMDRETFLILLGRYFEAVSLSTDWSSIKEADDERMINALAMLCPFQPEERQALLEAPSLKTRRETLVTLMEFSLRERGGTSGERLQ
jgi:hypothetical protein